MNSGGDGTLGFAILGAGSVADFHHRAVLENAGAGARLIAVGSRDPSGSGRSGEKFGVPCVSEAEVLARVDVDTVSICTPSGQHAAQTIAAARAGKHVLVEKPMALSLGDADTMISACEEAGVRLGILLQRRAEPVFRKIREAVTAGDFGELTLGAVSIPYRRTQEYYNQADWRGTWKLDGGGVLMNQGIHLLDLLVWYMGDPVSVQASAATLSRYIEVEDTLTATLTFANGGQATVTASTAAGAGFPHRVEVYGSKGGVQVEGESVRRWELADQDLATLEPPEIDESAEAGAGGNPQGISDSGHVAIYKDFIEAVRERRAPLADGREGRRSLAAVLEIYHAAGLPSDRESGVGT